MAKREKDRCPFGKFGEIARKKYLDQLAKGVGRCKAAKSVGVSDELVRLFRNGPGKELDPPWSEQEYKAESLSHENVENALYKSAMSGNVTAIQVWLYNRMPERWKDKRNLAVSVGDDDIDKAIRGELDRLAGKGQAADAATTPPDAGAEG